MNPMKALQDLSGKTESQIKDHLAQEYSIESDAIRKSNRKLLNDYSILFAYESVGSWGCDSSSWFLLRNKKTKALFEINGSHCSCYGFEGQFELESTTKEALQFRAGKGRVFSTGGYDDHSKQNTESSLDYVLHKL